MRRANAAGVENIRGKSGSARGRGVNGEDAVTMQDLEQGNAPALVEVNAVRELLGVAHSAYVVEDVQQRIGAADRDIDRIRNRRPIV